MLSSNCPTNLISSAEPSELSIEQHILWISRLISRIVSFRKSMDNSDSQSVSSPFLLLNLSFVRLSCIPQYSKLSLISKVPITITSLSNGQHYALISSLLTNDIFSFDPQRSVSSQFDIIFKSLASIGFKPRQPCSQFGLMSGIHEHHINLCETLEFAIFERSLSIEKLLDDIRKVPRSFFVIQEGYYPKKIEEAIALWLSKFPCINDLPEISYSDFDKFQEELSTGIYFSAVLSRIYPQRINKDSIVASKNGFDSNSETSKFFDLNLNISKTTNWEKSKQILNELGAFVPSRFPLNYNLFMCFISDLYYATRIGVKKFVRIERSPSAISSSRRPQTASIATKSIISSTTDITNQPKLVKFDQISIEKKNQSNKSTQFKPRTSPNVFRPARKKTIQNSVTASTNHHQKKINEIQVQKRAIKTAIPQKRPSLTISNKNVIKHASSNYGNKLPTVDDETELLHLFTCMTKGDRKDKFVDVDNPLIMVKPLCLLLNSEKVCEQTFMKFWSLIENELQSIDHYRNCFAFLNALGGNNNELAASRRIVYFARQMLKSYQEDPTSSCVSDNFDLNEKRKLKTSYQTRRDSLLKKAKKLTNNLNSSPDIVPIISASQSDSLIH